MNKAQLRIAYALAGVEVPPKGAAMVRQSDQRQRVDRVTQADERAAKRADKARRASVSVRTTSGGGATAPAPENEGQPAGGNPERDGAMNEPVRLTVVVPMMGQQAPYRLSDPCGYIVPNLMPATWVTHRPVEDIAHALEVDGYSPAVHFGLLNERAEILFIGPIGRKG